ncbi:MAG TPA: hypothetical protein VME17_16825 [Bryobacteraceae bacterium]|nr:hypothetical protein [Bryobacteraceae bacterium]
MAVYHLKSPIVGVEQSTTGMHIRRIGAGEVLTVPDTGQEKGLIEAVCRGQSVAIFVEDLMQRAEKVEARGA